jgi:hypothetical protein
MNVVGPRGPLPLLVPCNWRDRLADPRKGKYDDECVLAWIAARRSRV